MEPHLNAASVLRTSRNIPYSCLPQPFLSLTKRMLSSSPSSSTTPSSETRTSYSSSNPNPSFKNLSLFSNPHSLQSMTLSKCFSHSGPNNAIPASGLVEYGEMESLVVVSFYKFADFPDHAVLRVPLKQLCQQLVLHSFLFFIWRNYDYSCSSKFIHHFYSWCKTSIWSVNYDLILSHFDTLIVPMQLFSIY